MNATSSQPLIEFSAPMTREQAEAILDGNREHAIFILMELAARAAKAAGQKPAASTPSAMIPPYEKPNSHKRGKKPGAKPGHPGARRKTPLTVTKDEEHPPLKCCPDCGQALGEPVDYRFRLIEDIAESTPEVTKHKIPRQWCPRCRKYAEPIVPDALPGATFGHRLVTLTAWLHYGLGITLSRILSVLGVLMSFEVSQGGLVDAWERLAGLLYEWYEQIGKEVKAEGVLNADETGWRQAARTVWLWCFTAGDATYYMIDESRGSPALSKFFTEAFDGCLVTDFWSAYNSVGCILRQACVPHLLRELEETNKKDSSESWKEFSTKLKRLLKDAIRLRKRDDLSEGTWASRRQRISERFDELLNTPPENANVHRLLKRLKRYQDALFTFLDHPEVPFDNNHAEREIRPAVLMRKNSFCNRSKRGADTQAILMSVYRTLQRRGYDPLETIVNALKDYVITGKLPPLPPTKCVTG